MRDRPSGAHGIDTASFTPGGRSPRQIAEIVTGDGGAGAVGRKSDGE